MHCLYINSTRDHLWKEDKKFNLKKGKEKKGDKGKLIQFKWYFPRQSLKIFTFGIKLSKSIFSLLGLSPIVN